MTICFFSDAHGNQYSVKSMFEQLKEDRPDLVIFGGDIFGYYYGQADIISLLKKEKCVCLLGNHDQYFIDLFEGKQKIDYLVERYGKSYFDSFFNMNKYLNYVKSFNRRYDLVLDNTHLTFVHGTIDDPLNGRIYPDTIVDNPQLYNEIDYVFMGHTHHKLVKTLCNGTVLVNPGSIGQQRDGKGCSYILFNTETKELNTKTVSYNRELLINEIIAHKEKNEMMNRLIEVLYRKN